MSKLSEEEIIKYFKEVISWYRENTPDRVYALNNKDIEMLQGLLDLYNKEKEKNKELEKDILEMYYKGVVLDILQDELNISRDEAIEILDNY